MAKVRVYVFNLSEDVWPFIKGISDLERQKAEIIENAYLGDRGIFSLPKQAVFITAKTITPEFLAYFKRLMGFAPTDVLVPSKHSGRVCEDVIDDHNVLERLVSLGKKAGTLELTSYCVSANFYRLAKTLRDRGVRVETPEAPEEKNYWTVDHFGSKAGVRQAMEIQRMRRVSMANGGICSSVDDAVKVAAERYLRGKGVVVKTNRGHSGLGVVILRAGEIGSKADKVEGNLRERLLDAYWGTAPIVVEDYIETGEVGGGFPDVECRITPAGRVRCLYQCGMRVTSEGVFKGMEINGTVIPPEQARLMRRAARSLGRLYSDSGYRGYFDVDYAVGKDGRLFVTESNIRQTGGTHVYHMLRRLVGHDFMRKVYVLSNNGYALARPWTFPELLEGLKHLLYDKERGEGLVVVSENLLGMNLLAYVIIGNNRNRAVEIEAEMERALIGTVCCE